MVFINYSGHNRWPQEEDPEWEKGYRYDYMRDREFNRQYYGSDLDEAFERAQERIRRTTGRRSPSAWERPGPFSGMGPQGYRRSDERIRDDVHQVFTRHGRLDARQIHLTVENREVTLTGSVPDRRSRRMAEDLAASIPGVHDVHNRLEVSRSGRMQRLDSLEALFFDELRDLYDAERQLIDTLPRLAEAAHAQDLKRGFHEHLDQTRRQIERLERIFQAHGQQPDGVTSAGMRGILSAARQLLEQRNADPDVLDAALILAAQKAEHYEIAGYGSVRTYASTLGMEKEAGWLDRTLDEELKADRRLTSMAVGRINRQAQQ